MQIEENEYDLEIKKLKFRQKIEFYLAKIFQGIFYILGILLKLAIDVIKGVLRTLGLPIGN